MIRGLLALEISRRTTNAFPSRDEVENSGNYTTRLAGDERRETVDARTIAWGM